MVPSFFAYAAASDTGNVREQNEDGVLACGRFVRDGNASGRVKTDDKTLLFAVADGVGGAPAGEVASEFVLRDLERRFAALPAGHTSEREFAISSACHDADAALRSAARREPRHMGMATTCTGLVCGEAGAFWFNAGDSRLYRVRDERVKQVSTDHSLREEMHDSSIPGNIITNCYGMEGFRVDVEPLEIVPGDLFLLCSDGLSDYADAGGMNGALTDYSAVGHGSEDPSAPDLKRLEELASRLVSLALEGGGGDNVSLLLVEPSDG